MYSSNITQVGAVITYITVLPLRCTCSRHVYMFYIAVKHYKQVLQGCHHIDTEQLYCLLNPARLNVCVIDVL